MDNKRAQVVGERTYGDAALRQAITMDDGGAIILSVAKYYSPDGKAIQDTGVTPATLVSDAEPQIDSTRTASRCPMPPERSSGRKKKAGRRSGGEEGAGSAGQELSAARNCRGPSQGSACPAALAYSVFK